MKKSVFLLSAMMLPLSVIAQTIDFESHTGYKSIGVYDTWEESPFRTGEMKGNAQVVDNFLKDGNKSSRVLGVQRSRFGSNTFGVRIDLDKPFEISPETKYVHVKIHKPVAGKVMLVGLGKRTERAGQSPETEQFWVFPDNEIVPDKWNDAVFAVRGNKGIEIHSLVVVPDCASPHNLKEDFAAYVDDIEITSDKTPRINLHDVIGSSSSADKSAFVTLHAGSRNGYITDIEGGELLSVQLPKAECYVIKATPAPGFTLDYIIIKSKSLEKKVEASRFACDGTFKIPAEWITEDLTIEGEFKSIDKK